MVGFFRIYEPSLPEKFGYRPKQVLAGANFLFFRKNVLFSLNLPNFPVAFQCKGIQRVAPAQLVALGGPAASLAVLKEQGFQGLVVFNPITPQQLLCTVASSGLLPPGVSRFLSPRAECSTVTFP